MAGENKAYGHTDNLNNTLEERRQVVQQSLKHATVDNAQLLLQGATPIFQFYAVMFQAWGDAFQSLASTMKDNQNKIAA